VDYGFLFAGIPGLFANFDWSNIPPARSIAFPDEFIR
jgi:hypothetical protein